MIDAAAIGRWLGRPVVVDGAVGAGTSKTSWRVRVDGQEAVLALSPTSASLPSAHDLGREHRFLSALAGTRVPVPAVLAYCDDPAVAGAPFLISAAVPGWCALDEPDRPLDPWSVGMSAVDALAELHALDPSIVGPPPGSRGYVERQVRRWAAQLAHTPTAVRLGDLDPLVRWLLDNRPPDEERRLVHGDYGFHNLVVDGHRVTAVLDWELATVGDPVADACFFVKSWGHHALSKNPANDAVALRPGAPDRRALEDRYHARTGRSLDARRTFYDVFGLWRSIGIQEGVHARSGGRRLAAEVPEMVATARRLAGLDAPDPAPTANPSVS